MRLVRTLALVCALGALGASPARAAEGDDALLAPAGACGAAAAQRDLSPDAARQAVLCLTNYARTQSGLQPVQLDEALNRAGQEKLAANVSCGEFSHTPCGKPFSDAFAGYLAGASSYRIGENIAWGSGGYGSARETMRGWLGSPAHRENLLRPEYRDLGVGYLPSETFLGHGGVSLWSQQFGVRSPSPATPAGVPARVSEPVHEGASTVPAAARKQQRVRNQPSAKRKQAKQARPRQARTLRRR
jgi:uncharacterized protein YkwD